jgi:hypothetical protein
MICATFVLLFCSLVCADSVCDSEAVCTGAPVPPTSSHMDELARCQALGSVDARACAAAQCDWVPDKTGGYCTKRFVVPRLSDDAAHAGFASEADVRRWGAQHCAALGWRARTGPLPRVFDTFIFYNELELLEIRLNELSDVIDRFVLVEADRTFTFKPKPLHFKEHEAEYDTFLHQISAFNCPLPAEPPGAHDDYKRGWNREHAQRACVHDALAGLREGDRPRPDDIVLLSDVDEVPRREPILALKACDVDSAELERGVVFVERQHAYTFYYELGERSDWPGYANWPGTVAVSQPAFERMHAGGVRFARDNKALRRIYDAGWHFSPFPFGDASRVVDKLGAWAHQEERRQTSEYRDQRRWQAAIAKGDGCRKLTKRSDYLALPLYVRDNRQRYEHLLLPESELSE